MTAREEATARVNAALDRGETPADADLMICDTVALTRAALDQRDRHPLISTPGFAPRAESWWMAQIEAQKKDPTS